ncbi:flagellar hook-length control protein FliK [Marispirochaeta sp.]|uniref:flagellar hook-length control protein FliK n=1 Tax=Marispirochaeta sp. TaxID=2038653 RepID=UPI0029C8E75B|nr:flagellar hook-length control protein FliK [Marispirochaeta sp.]
MISPVEILSYNSRPADFSPQGPEVEGPSFGEYLTRAEEDRGGSSVQQEAEQRDSDLQPKAAVQRDDQESRVSDEDTVKSQTKDQGSDSSADKDSARSGDTRENAEESVSGKKSDNDNYRTESVEKDNRETRLITAKRESGEIPVPVGKENREKKNLKDSALLTKNASHGLSEADNDSAKSDVEKSEKDRSKDENLNGSGFPVKGDTENSGSLSAAVAEGAKRQSSQKDEASEGFSRPDPGAGVKNGDENSQAIKAEIIDLRRQKAQKNEQSSEKVAGKIDSTGVQDAAKPENPGRQEFLVLEPVQSKGDGNIARSDSQPVQAAADLSRALKDEGNAEILKKAQFVLKDRDQGEIRLILKPEKLGEVRIRLNLTDNRHIAGRIIVENNSVREVFQENMEALNRAFRENGFQTTGLDVSVGQREGFSGRRRERNMEGVPVEKLTRIFDEQIPRVEDYLFGDSRVNVYV